MRDKEEWTVEQGLALLDRALGPFTEELVRVVEEKNYHAFNQLVTALDYIIDMARAKLEEDIARQKEALQ